MTFEIKLTEHSILHHYKTMIHIAYCQTGLGSVQFCSEFMLLFYFVLMLYFIVVVLSGL
jgi:hypothetical protein